MPKKPKLGIIILKAFGVGRVAGFGLRCIHTDASKLHKPDEKHLVSEFNKVVTINRTKGIWRSP